MVDFFNKIEVLPGLQANGELTLGENLADHGGLNVAYLAFQNATKDAPLGVVDGFTPEQRFFLAYATLWAGNIRDEQIRVYTKYKWGYMNCCKVHIPLFLFLRWRIHGVGGLFFFFS